MAGGFARDGAVQDQIDATVEDAVNRARDRLPRGESLLNCAKCASVIFAARREAVSGVRLCVNCQAEQDKKVVTYSGYNRRRSKDSHQVAGRQSALGRRGRLVRTAAHGRRRKRKFLSMRYLALATDYDGTLARDSRVDAATLAALERLRASGRRAILVTGLRLDDLLEVCHCIDQFD